MRRADTLVLAALFGAGSTVCFRDTVRLIDQNQKKNVFANFVSVQTLCGSDIAPETMLGGTRSFARDFCLTKVQKQ